MVLVRPMPFIRTGPYLKYYAVIDTKICSSSKPDEQILPFRSKALSRSNLIAFSSQKISERRHRPE